MQTQNLLRHALSETISEGIINCLIVTNSRCVVVQLGAKADAYICLGPQ